MEDDAVVLDMTRLAYLLALTACAAEPDPDGPRDWECEFIWTCGPSGTADVEHFEAKTADEMWTIASEWTVACDQIAKYAVSHRTCPFVFCAAPCTTEPL